MINYKDFYHAFDDINIKVGSGSGSGDGSGSGSGVGLVDECGQPISDPGNTCGRLAQIEGNGNYTQDTNGSTGASGRYQIEQATAVGVMKSIGQGGSSDSSRRALWQKCRSSSSAECSKLQDDICASYAGTMSGETIRDVYAQWNMGKSGAAEIAQAHATTGQVTNPARIRKMDNQAWTKNNPSHGDTAKFYAGMEKYMRSKGIDPSAAA